MSKMLKVIAMLLVIAAVLFVSGCTSNAPTAENTTPAAPAHETNATAGEPAETNASAVVNETNASIVTEAETNASAVMTNITETNNTKT